jgi:hypothetical protein
MGQHESSSYIRYDCTHRYTQRRGWNSLRRSAEHGIMALFRRLKPSEMPRHSAHSYGSIYSPQPRALLEALGRSTRRRGGADQRGRARIARPGHFLADRVAPPIRSTGNSVARAAEEDRLSRQIAMRLNVDLATAAMILALVLNGGLMPQKAMAEGGNAKAGEPILVGERGAEVIVPQKQSTTIPIPKWKHGMGDRAQEDAGYSFAHIVKPEAWDRWLAGLPESKNVEDWRTPQQKIEDNNLWRVSWDPTFENPYEQFYAPGAPGGKPLVQFPPVSTTPDWLRDQETQWVKTKANR